MNRIQMGSAAFVALTAIDVSLTAAAYHGSIDVNFSTADFIASFITVPLSAAIAGLLFRRKNLGWWLAILYVAFSFADAVRAELTESDSWMVSAVVLGLVSLLSSGILWFVDVDRVGEFLESPPPDIRMFKRRPSRIFLLTGVVLIGTGLAGLIWPPLILVVGLTMFASWLRGRNRLRA